VIIIQLRQIGSSVDAGEGDETAASKAQISAANRRKSIFNISSAMAPRGGNDDEEEEDGGYQGSSSVPFSGQSAFSGPSSSSSPSTPMSVKYGKKVLFRITI
jgi:hypothetical protein